MIFKDRPKALSFEIPPKAASLAPPDAAGVGRSAQQLGKKSYP